MVIDCESERYAPDGNRSIADYEIELPTLCPATFASWFILVIGRWGSEQSLWPNLRLPLRPDERPLYLESCPNCHAGSTGCNGSIAAIDTASLRKPTTDANAIPPTAEPTTSNA